MKTKNMLIVGLLLVGNFAIACLGGHQSAILTKKTKEEIGTIDKHKKELILNKGAELISIGNCNSTSAPRQGSGGSNTFNINDYFNTDLCFAIKYKNVTEKYSVTNSQLTSVARDIMDPKKCGGTISSK